MKSNWFEILTRRVIALSFLAYLITFHFVGLCQSFNF